MRKLFLLICSAFIVQIGFTQSTVSQKPLICGHRGGFYTELPENSLGAFEYTLQNGTIQPMIVEFDIRKSKDGTLFIMHDESVDRTTTGTGAISELSDGYLGSLFLKCENGKATSFRIPTFRDILSFAKGKNIKLMLDIKADVWSDVVQQLNTAGLMDKAIFLTFRFEDSERVYKLAPNATISSLIRNEEDYSWIQQSRIPARNLVAYVIATTDTTVIKKLKEKKIKVMTDVSENNHLPLSQFTESYYLNFAHAKQVDILITDFPVNVSKVFRQRNNK